MATDTGGCRSYIMAAPCLQYLARDVVQIPLNGLCPDPVGVLRCWWRCRC